ncbi:glycosyltransferase [Aliiglaciecola sp. M165]|uniref:glycosyltransferase n=1 Tax=Aliiglaciecola sp. M165 TaxID=2593649 RepID=UPI00117C7203|nr:glycosyltransferase [Aliiglaciecola sp. M165]TRY30826.1 glycosyltransferase [Aliiglaciecola sp. M165]
MNNKTSVCFVSSTLSKGGAERALSNLLCNMDRSQLDISVLLLNGIVTYPVPEDVTIVDLRKRSAMYLPLCFMLLIKHLVRIKPDILISVWSFPSLLTGIALKLSRLKTNWVVRVANNPADQEDDWRKKVFYHLYQRAKRYIVLCDDLEENFLAYYPFSKGKTRMIRNGFDLEALETKADEAIEDTWIKQKDYLVSVGSLTDQKRYDILLNAMAMVSPEKRLPLVVLGDGPLRQSLEKQTNELQLTEWVIFKGFVTNPYPYVKHAKIFVLNSDYEGLCNAAIEAQCLGVPAVITDCPTGNREIVVNGVTGYLVDMADPNKMAEGIEKVLNLNADDFQNMKNAASSLVGTKYRIENSAKQLNELISEFG